MAPIATAELPKDIDTTLNFYLSPEKGGHDSFQVGTAAYYTRKFDPHNETIHDIRGQEEHYDLNTHGFQYFKHSSALVPEDYRDEEKVKQIGYPEAEEILKKATGATSVYVFSHITRVDSRDEQEKAVAAGNIDLSQNINKVTPARYIHIDQSNRGAVEVLYDNMPADVADKLAKTRWSIINVWRPIKGPVVKDPLAVADARSVRDEDLTPVSANFPPRDSGLKYATLSKGTRFELFYLKWKEGQRWHYISEMTPDETLLIKCFDSIQDGKTARRVPHTAFSDPKTKDLEVNRESIETRCLVFYEDQPAQ